MAGFFIFPSVILSVLLIFWFFYILLRIFMLPFWLAGKILKRKKRRKNTKYEWRQKNFTTENETIGEKLARAYQQPQGHQAGAGQQEAADKMNAEREKFDKEKERHRREQQAFWEEMKRAYAAAGSTNRTPSCDPYEILGVSKSASPTEIKARFRELAMQFHPDKAAQATPEIQKLAELEFRKIKEAYDSLIK